MSSNGAAQRTPVVLPGGLGVLVPGPMCAHIASALTLILANQRDQSKPADLVAVRDAAQQAAVGYHREWHRVVLACATATTQLASFDAQAQTAGPSPAEITTTTASDLTGLSPQRWRQLAGQGRVPARRDSGGRWLLDKAAVLGYAKETNGWRR